MIGIFVSMKYFHDFDSKLILNVENSVTNRSNEGVMTSFVNEKTAHGTACGRLCVLRQCFNRLYQSCPIIENMFVKVKTSGRI